ncbi:hypothetical protein M758_4G192400 [Ceratodon purpureus]|nr:hypothetical protein M758_4G192400 [Ceratodon purpureus]
MEIFDSTTMLAQSRSKNNPASKYPLIQRHLSRATFHDVRGEVFPEGWCENLLKPWATWRREKVAKHLSVNSQVQAKEPFRNRFPCFESLGPHAPLPFSPFCTREAIFGINLVHPCT